MSQVASLQNAPLSSRASVSARRGLLGYPLDGVGQASISFAAVWPSTCLASAPEILNTVADANVAHLPTRKHGSAPVLSRVGTPASSLEELRQAEDEVLAKALIAKNAQAPRVAWDRFSPMVRRIVRRSLGPGNDVEDLVQEVFLCLFSKVSGLREPKVLKAFTISIATLTVRQELRRRKVRRWVGLGREATAVDLRVVHPDPEARQALDHFYAILDRFSGRDRTAFVLRHIEGMELTEVAQALDISLATTKRCLARVSQRVKLHMERDSLLRGYLNAPSDSREPAASSEQHTSLGHNPKAKGAGR